MIPSLSSCICHTIAQPDKSNHIYSVHLCWYKTNSDIKAVMYYTAAIMKRSKPYRSTPDYTGALPPGGNKCAQSCGRLVV